MKSRQALVLITSILLLASSSACSTSNARIPTATAVPPTFTSTSAVAFTPSPLPSTPTPAPLACLTEPGEVRQDAIPATEPLQEFIIYLPPCYGVSAARRYPVLYLLHGQTYDQDQWVRLGVPPEADQLIHSAESVPFIIVFPDNHYWYAPASGSFGNRLINTIIPYVDENYLTLSDREDRALGGLSSGGGLTIELGFEHAELFGSLGLHSPAVLRENAPYVEDNIRNIADESRPRLWFDIGDQDSELGSGRLLEEILTRNNYLHEFHLFSGDHTENYWAAHVEEYLRWYVQPWQAAPQR